MEQNDLTGVKVGDKLYSLQNGEGEVIEIDGGSVYSITVSFAGGQPVRCFTYDGKVRTKDLLPILFWRKPTIIYPPPPVAIEVKGWVGFVRNGEEIYPRTMLFQTEDEANFYADRSPNKTVPMAIYICHKYREEDKDE